MSPRLTRRAFLTAASAAAVAGGATQTLIRGQSAWSLNPQVEPLTSTFQLRVSYVVEFFDSAPLYIQVADQRGPEYFFLWARISESTGSELFDFGPFDIPFGGAYAVSVVTATGDRHYLSPVVPLLAPSLPEEATAA